MQITDPIADMLTRIRNANSAKHATVDVPASKLKKAIAQILLEEGYIKSYEVVEGDTQGIIRITLKYLPSKEKVITGLRRVSKPGLRVYAGGAVRAVMEAVGITNIHTKCLRSNNPQNVVKATMAGLESLRSPEAVAAIRGKSVEELKG